MNSDTTTYDDDDIEDLRVNFSDAEASSEARDFEALPSGKYPVTIYDGEVRRVKDTDADGNPNKNAGKPYWNLQFAVTEDHWASNRRFFGSVMLFSGALYSLSQLMKALGEDVDSGDFKVPPLDDLIGQELVIGVEKKKDTYKMKRDGIPANQPVFKNEVRSYFKQDGTHKYAAGAKASGGTVSSGGESLLPS